MVVNDTAYLVLLLAPFGPAASVAPGRPVGLSGPEDLDAAVAALAGTFTVAVPRADCPEGTVDVPVARLADFKPASILRNSPWLARIAAALGFLEAAGRDGQSPAAIAAGLEADFPDLPLAFTVPGATPSLPVASAADPGASAIDAVLGMVATAAASPRPAPGAAPAAWKASLEALCGRIMAAIFSDPAFRAAEAAWRGVRLMLQNAGADSVLRLVLRGADANTLPDALAAVVRESEAMPVNCILADVALDAAPARMVVWTALAETADALLTPAVACLSPAFFHLDSFDAVSRIGYPVRALEDAAYAKWRKLAATSGGSWLAATGNRFVLRAAYGPDNPARDVRMTESEPLWGSPVWAFGAALARALAGSGWPHRMGVAAGVVLENLDVVTTDGKARAVEALLGEEQVGDFAAAGLTALSGWAGGDAACFGRAVAIDGSPLAEKLFFNRVLTFFFRCRADAVCGEELAASGAKGLAALLAKRFSLFFQATGVPVPADLTIDGMPQGGGARLAVGFTPPAALGVGTRRLTFDFAW